MSDAPRSVIPAVAFSGPYWQQRIGAARLTLAQADSAAAIDDAAGALLAIAEGAAGELLTAERAWRGTQREQLERQATGEALADGRCTECGSANSTHATDCPYGPGAEGLGTLASDPFAESRGSDGVIGQDAPYLEQIADAKAAAAERQPDE